MNYPDGVYEVSSIFCKKPTRIVTITNGCVTVKDFTFTQHDFFSVNRVVKQIS